MRMTTDEGEKIALADIITGHRNTLLSMQAEAEAAGDKVRLEDLKGKLQRLCEQEVQLKAEVS